MEPSVHTDRVAEYLAEVRPHLDDLDPSERAEVLEELGDALREVAAENDRSLRDVVGPPADYVAAYRASAGLEPRGRLQSGGAVRTRVAAVRDTVRAQPWWPQVLQLGRLLRPSWWTVRGGVLAALPVWLWSGSLSSLATIPGVVYVTAVVAVSMAVGDGRQLRQGLRHALIAANVIAAFAVMPTISTTSGLAVSSSFDDGYQAGLQEGYGGMAQGQLAKPSGELVTNIHPYTRDGKPLEDVLLFDGDGQPLRVVPESETLVYEGDREIEIAHERDADGQPITNLYPLQQSVVEYDDNTGEVAGRRPRTAPAVVLPPAMRTDASEAAASESTADGTAPAAAPSER